MGTDKAALVVNGELNLRDRGMQLLQAHTEECYLSIASDDTRPHPHPTLPDRHEGIGPLGGLEAAIAHAPEAAWLVLACDLPLLTEEVLARLVAERDSASEATCVTSRFDGLPVPLCAIYEPAAAVKLAQALENDRRCARKFLLSLERTELALPDPAALDNCNRPEDLEEARLRTEHGAVPKTIEVEFCGKLRDEAGERHAHVQTTAATAAGLWEELRMSRQLSLGLDSVKVAINDELVPWTHPLHEADRLALFPPFAGG